MHYIGPIRRLPSKVMNSERKTTNVIENFDSNHNIFSSGALPCRCCVLGVGMPQGGADIRKGGGTDARYVSYGECPHIALLGRGV